jgi:hypothetical protein
MCLPSPLVISRMKSLFSRLGFFSSCRRFMSSKLRRLSQS